MMQKLLRKRAKHFFADSKDSEELTLEKYRNRRLLIKCQRGISHDLFAASIETYLVNVGESWIKTASNAEAPLLTFVFGSTLEGDSCNCCFLLFHDTLCRLPEKLTRLSK